MRERGIGTRAAGLWDVDLSHRFTCVAWKRRKIRIGHDDIFLRRENRIEARKKIAADHISVCTSWRLPRTASTIKAGSRELAQNVMGKLHGKMCARSLPRVYAAKRLLVLGKSLDDPTFRQPLLEADDKDLIDWLPSLKPARDDNHTFSTSSSLPKREYPTIVSNVVDCRVVVINKWLRGRQPIQ